MEILQPPGWPRPRGYVNGVAAEGKLVFVAGQIGWNERGEFPRADMAGQVDQALANTMAVLREAGAGPEHIARMTWYVTDRDAYLEATKALGPIFKAHLHGHYPVMAVIVVTALVEPQAQVEIETTAVIGVGPA